MLLVCGSNPQRRSSPARSSLLLLASSRFTASALAMDATPALYRQVIDEVLTKVQLSMQQFGWDDETVLAKVSSTRTEERKHANREALENHDC